MIRSMAMCASCGAAEVRPGTACSLCGAMADGGLELDLRARAAAKPAAPRKLPKQDAPLELAVDPRELVEQRAVGAHPAPLSYGHGGAALQAPPPRIDGRAQAPVPARDPEAELAADAEVLADYGEAPKRWVTAPLYAWRVMKRQRELKTAHAARQVEAEHAATVLEDGLVAFAAEARAAAEKQAAYAVALEALARAEDALRSRDKVLAAEQDAQKARLAQVDARLTGLEAELAQAQIDERVAAEQLAAAQQALAREEAKMARAEAELKAARQREGGGPA
jgi:hypothetical protein